jgi:branched-chain amino acid transport system substrate-binding protein
LNRHCAVLLLFTLSSVGFSDPPAYRLRDKQMEYYGPGRESEPETGTDKIPIGWFGPSDPKHPESGDLWCAAQMAIEQANAAGGYQGKHFQLLPVWSETPWDEGARRLAGLVYREGVVALVGGMDGPSTHVAEQIAAKARLPVIAPASTDKSINLAGVPWIFSCLPGDHLLAPVLADSMVREDGSSRIVLLCSTDHDPHLFAVELQAALRERKIGLSHHIDFGPKTADLGLLVRRAIKAAADSVVVVADARTSAKLVVALRESGFEGNIFCGPEAARRSFVEIAGASADGTCVPVPSDQFTSQEARGFCRLFRERWGRDPDFAAVQTFDAVSMLVAAVRKAGPNRVQIADALRELAPYQGVAGVIRWDRVGANTRSGRLGMYRNGRLVEAE